MQILDQIPLWGFFIITVLLSLLCVEGGFRVGRRNTAKEQETAIGPMITSMLSLLAFMVTFTFGLAATRFDNRRMLVTEESNAIGTAYLRTDFIEEPCRTNVRNLLREYVDIRVNDVFQKTDPTQSKAEILQDQLWQKAAIIGQKHPYSQVGALFIDSLNQMIDVHAQRIAARLRARVPKSIWYTLFLIAAIAMAGTGYNSGIVGRRSLLTSIMLATMFSTVIVLVIDLDRPGEGFLQANQQSMIDLRKKIGPSIFN